MAIGKAQAVVGTMQFLSEVGAGLAKKREMKALAKQSELDALSDEVSRMEDLNEAMAMQAVMFGAGGVSAGVGSAKAITEQSLTQFEREKKMIRAKGRAKAAGLRARGHRALTTGFSKGALKAGSTFAGKGI